MTLLNHAQPNFDLGFTLTTSQEVTIHEIEEILEAHSQGTDDNSVPAPIDIDATAVARASDTRVIMQHHNIYNSHNAMLR